MDEAVQEAKLLRQVNALIVAHLRGQSLGQAAAAVAVAMTPCPPPRVRRSESKKKTPREEGSGGSQACAFLRTGDENLAIC